MPINPINAIDVKSRVKSRIKEEEYYSNLLRLVKFISDKGDNDGNYENDGVTKGKHINESRWLSCPRALLLERRLAMGSRLFDTRNGVSRLIC